MGAPGNVISNEPGYYEDGSFGIRIENIVMVKEAETKHKFGDKPYLGFEHVTMVPYCRKLIDESLLTRREKHWLRIPRRHPRQDQGFLRTGFPGFEVVGAGDRTFLTSNDVVLHKHGGL